ncbi:MAG: hypothetical protein ABJE66_05675 [Deltaproteobacteria bacterium]
MRVWLVTALLLGACTIKERDQKGPEIHIEMDQRFIQVGDQNPGANFMLDTDPSYSIDITITTIDGQEDDSTTLSYSPVASIDPVFTVPTITVPNVAFTTGGSSQDVTYKSSSPLAIPASAKGQTMTIHVDGKDSNGLASNTIDFTAKLE